MDSITMLTNSGEVRISVSENLIECPNCHKAIIPKPLYARSRGAGVADIMLQCPDSKDCKACFVSVCQGNNSFYRTDGPVFKGTVAKKSFNDLIVNLSPSFSEIYNEAYNAEQLELSQICGVGYRKAIEFLMKDFAIMNNPDKDEEIKKMPLMQCIKKYIDSNNVKKVAERAVWLGNDETHYVRVWDAKDLQDLKKLIELTVHWIEVELLTKELEDDMPRKS